jgi:threonylcarbamoyladenosine tRNA methylthiotransferase MtaB
VRYHRSVPGYYVENFGCRATQADGAALERQFEELGLARAASPAQAAVVVLNTCTVTAAADQDARAAVRRVQRQNPDAQIVVTGCYAQRAPQEVAALPGVAFVVGNSHKHNLAEIVLAHELRSEFGWRSVSSAANHDSKQEGASAPQAFIPLATLSQRPMNDDQPAIFVSDIFAHTELLAAPVFDAAGFSHENERTRPNLKIQDGCDNRCSFCVIPFVRGQSRSLELDRILHEVSALVAAGYREVVISGINLGRWGRDLSTNHVGTAALGCPDEQSSPAELAPARTLESLIRTILEETSLEKLRISSVEPMDWSDQLIALMASSPRIAKHAHVPLQSGSDAVLRRMHRKYRPWHYREKIEKIRTAMPYAAIGADVMVGFPGETESEFDATHRMIEDLPFTYLHVFTYSARPGTPAAAMPNQVPAHVARERSRILRDLAAQKKLAFMRSFIGSEVAAITLKCGAGAPAREARGNEQTGCVPGEPACTEALTDNYLKLHLQGQHEPNRWLRARVEDVVDGALVGKVVETHPRSEVGNSCI